MTDMWNEPKKPQWAQGFLRGPWMGFRGIFDSPEIVKNLYECAFFCPKEIFTFYQFHKWIYDPENIIILYHFREINKKLFIFIMCLYMLSSVQFSHSVMSNSLQPHGLLHARHPCPSPTPWACSNSCPSSRWCHSTISSSVFPFSSCLQSFPASGSFPVSQFFTSGAQSIGVLASASVLPMNIQDWFPLGWTGWISLQSEGLSRVFSNTTVQKHQFFGAQLSL